MTLPELDFVCDDAFFPKKMYQAKSNRRPIFFYKKDLRLEEMSCGPLRTQISLPWERLDRHPDRHPSLDHHSPPILMMNPQSFRVLLS